MLNSGMFVRSEKYRNTVIDWMSYPRNANINYEDIDKPLIAQLAGNNIDVLLDAGKMLQAHVTGLDLNLGCPQKIAKRGNYGAYLLPQTEKVCLIVESLCKNLECPISVKIRKFDNIADTIALCRDLESCGISMLTMHGRTRQQNKQLSGPADWTSIAEVRKSLSIPVIANGGIESLEDVSKCLSVTGAHGVMSSEGILENPYLFSRTKYTAAYSYDSLARIDTAKCYLQIVDHFINDSGRPKE